MKVLIVLTSHDRLGNTDQKTGFWLEVFASPHYYLLDAGAELTLASPNGGQPPLDPKSDEGAFQTPAPLRPLQRLYGRRCGSAQAADLGGLARSKPDHSRHWAGLF